MSIKEEKKRRRNHHKNPLAYISMLILPAVARKTLQLAKQ